MKIPSIQRRLKKAGVFDIAKILHSYFPDVSTKRINDLILQVDSVDQAVDVLFTTSNKDLNLPLKSNCCVSTIFN